MAERFSRQIRFAPIGAEGQRRLHESSVLLVGVGALGTHVATSLVRSGVGKIWLVDRDIVEPNNLQRQVLFTERDAAEGRPKAVAAAAALAQAWSDCVIHPVMEDFDAEVFTALGGTPDLIVDGTDNFSTRYLLNDLAVQHGIPWVYGGALGSRGTAMSVLPGRTPCLRCLMPEAPVAGEVGTCETEGVLAPTVAAVAAFQSAEALKILTGHTDRTTRGVWSFDHWENRHTLQLRHARPDPTCATCGRREFPALRGHRATVRLCGRNATQVQPGPNTRVDLPVLADRVRTIATEVELTPHLLRFRVEGCGFSVFRGGRALLFGVDEPKRAQTLYDRYVGAG